VFGIQDSGKPPLPAAVSVSFTRLRRKLKLMASAITRFGTQADQ